MSKATKSYDYFIIGSGPAGQVVAPAAAKADKTVGIGGYQRYGGTSRCGVARPKARCFWPQYGP